MSKFNPISFFAACMLLCLASSVSVAQRSNPSEQETQQWRQRGPCRDPWVSKAVSEYKGSVAGRGNVGECNPAMYAGGSWSSYDELYRGVAQALSAISSAGSITMTGGGDRFTITIDLGERATSQVVTNAGGNIISNDGGSIVASGGGNYRVQSTATDRRVNLGKSVLIVRKR